MTVKDIKQEARKKLALNMHQAIAVYAVEFTIFITLIALVVMSCVCLSVSMPAAIVMMCYGIVLAVIAVVGMGMVNFAMVDFYIMSYKCKPYSIRRLGETLARSNVTKIFLLSLKRTLIGILLLLCLIVPGVIYLMRTSMANYLLIANPNMTAKTALSASNKVMSGKTGAYFSLRVSLSGWYVLGILTLGLGFILILPYTNLIKAVYYKRNLQGDKAVYVYSPVQQASPVKPTATGAAGSAVREQAVAPIDTLEADDVMEMNDAMRGFGSVEAVADVKEVPIMPVAAKQPAANNIEPESPEIPKVIDLIGGDADPIPQMIADEEDDKSNDDTSIVETERMLSAEELRAGEESKRRAIESMYSGSGSRKPAADYFSGGGKSNPNDFVTAEVDDFVAYEAPTDRVIAQSSSDGAEHIISDSELDAFLRDFDSAEKTETTSRPTQGGRTERTRERAGAASPTRPTSRPSDRTADRTNVSSRRAAEPNREVSDRAERLRREREERLNKNK